jgi:hypothetical protein
MLVKKQLRGNRKDWNLDGARSLHDASICSSVRPFVSGTILHMNNAVKTLIRHMSNRFYLEKRCLSACISAWILDINPRTFSVATTPRYHAFSEHRELAKVTILLEKICCSGSGFSEGPLSLELHHVSEAK